MSSYDKVVKAATKSKAGAPKPKHMDPIIASSFSSDGSLQDITRSLALRLREPSSIVVFKALLVLHTLIRNGGVDNVLRHVSSENGSLKLKNVAAGGNWQGYDAPRSLPSYSLYLDSRVSYYREMHHDVIRSSDAARTNGGDGGGAGHRLRRLTVDRGLLREVANAQKVCSRLLDCSFFFDDLNDDMSITALRMALKDLFALYTAINEGMINILEHYFEMSKPDAERALEIYKRFTRHTEKVVAYLQAARKAAYSLNVAIPNLKHAPTSLAGALEEYLKDPNFEQNRKEYAANRRAANGLPPKPESKVPASESKKSTAEKEKDKPSSPAATEVKLPTGNQALQDFFESIESEQQSIFGPGGPSTSQFGFPQQQQGLAPQMTGFPMGAGGFGGGSMQPQMTGFNPFFQQQQQQQQQQSFPGQQFQQGGMGGLQPQITGFAPGGFLGAQPTGMLQPQMTGMNPFRQSMMMGPQPTGMGSPLGGQAFSQPTQQQQQQTPQHSSAPGLSGLSPQEQTPSSAFGSNNAFASTSAAPPASNVAAGQSLGAPAKLLPQKTGSNNPFKPPPGSTPPPSPPPTNKGPTLQQLAMGAFGPPQQGGGVYGLGHGAWNPTAQQQSQPQNAGANGASQLQTGPGSQSQTQALVPMKTGLISSVASEFASGRGNAASPAPTAQPSSAPAATSPSLNAASLTGQQGAGASLASPFAAMSVNGSNGFAPPSPLAPQKTGFAGSNIKPFQPTSSFGASLAASSSFAPSPSLSPAPTSGLPPNMTGNPFAYSTSTQHPSQPATAPQAQSNEGFPSFASAASASQGTPAASNFGLNPSGLSLPPTNPSYLPTQPTGFGASLFGTTSTPSSAPFQASGPSANTTSFGSNAALAPQPTGFAGSNVKPFQPTSAFGNAAFVNLNQQNGQQAQ
ncbi:ANTH-domain-containing protein, partial [Ceraceosorus guamensis]